MGKLLKALGSMQEDLKNGEWDSIAVFVVIITLVVVYRVWMHRRDSVKSGHDGASNAD